MAIRGSSSRLSLMIQRTSIRNSSRARTSENRRMLRDGIFNRVLRGSAKRESLDQEMSMITLKVNGRTHTLDADPATPLLYILSDDMELRGPKFGCGLGQCGCCTVIV